MLSQGSGYIDFPTQSATLSQTLTDREDTAVSLMRRPVNLYISALRLSCQVPKRPVKIMEYMWCRDLQVRPFILRSCEAAQPSHPKIQIPQLRITPQRSQMTSLKGKLNIEANYNIHRLMSGSRRNNELSEPMDHIKYAALLSRRRVSSYIHFYIQ